MRRRHCRASALQHTTGPSQAGYTLIEILLVVTLIAIAAAIVAPSFVTLTGASVDDEARRLQQILRLGAEEAQLTGIPLRIVVLKNGYRFELLSEQKSKLTGNAGGEPHWAPLEEAPFTSHQFDDGIEIGALQFSGEVPAEQPAAADGEEELLGYLSFWPDGMLDAADISISAPESGHERVVQLRSGPGGIRLLEAAS